MNVKDKIIGRIHKAPDLDLAVKVTTIEGEKFVNVRDYVPSTKQFGHGALFRIDLLPQVIETLQGVEGAYGSGKGTPGEGQQVLL